MHNPIELKYGNHGSKIFMHRESAQTYTIGDRAAMHVVIGDQLVRDYAHNYGDRNPIHLDEQAGLESIFKSRIAHECCPLTSSRLCSRRISRPRNDLHRVDSWRFIAPVKIGDELSVEVSVFSCRQKSSGAFELTFDARAVKTDGTSVMSGKLHVIAPRPN